MAPAGPGALIDLLRRLRAGAHAQVAGLLHDGPAQHLGAAMTALELARRAESPGWTASVEAAAAAVAAAARDLRAIIDGQGSLVTGTALPEVLRAAVAPYAPGQSGVAADAGARRWRQPRRTRFSR